MHARPHLAAAAALAAALATLPAGAEEIKLTAISGHPPVTLGVAYLRDFYIPEVNKRLAASGKHRIAWTEAYGGSVAKPDAVLEAIEKGIGDVGYMPALFEADKLPLDQITYVTPFGSGDLPKVIQVFRQLREKIPEINQAYVKHKLVYLAGVGVDNYHLVTKFPVTSRADLDGKKFGTAGLASNWLKGTGAVPVSGALTTYYNSLQTGVIDGIITFESALKGYKFYEVAPYVTKVSFGAQYASAVVMNKSRWDHLPADVRAVFTAVGKEYETKVNTAYRTAGEESLKIAIAAGAKVSELSEEERRKLAAGLPNVAKDWAKAIDAKGQPGTRTLTEYMELSRKVGIHHAREWDKE